MKNLKGYRFRIYPNEAQKGSSLKHLVVFDLSIIIF